MELLLCVNACVHREGGSFCGDKTPGLYVDCFVEGVNIFFTCLMFEFPT